ncbi:MAG: hypothetical protein LBN95_05985 [Prevotellaceae bacterium]|nr:hypothetical protein [Prevotellaceae bacterium]
METIVERLPMSISVGTVKDVDKGKRTCTVEREERPTLFNVRLNSVISDYTEHFTVFPKPNSYVLVIALGDNTECFLLATSEVEEISLKIGSQTLKANKDGFVFNSGNNDGLVKIEKLVEKINNVESKINDVINGLNAVIIPLAPSGSYALSTNFAATATLPSTTQNELEDTKIKH